MLQIGRSLVRSQLVSLEFFIDIILLIALWPWGQLSLYQKWVPGVFPGDKGGQCIRLTTLPPSCAVVMKSGNLNFLEPSGPLSACNRLLYLYLYHISELLVHLRKVTSLFWALWYRHSFTQVSVFLCRICLLDFLQNEYWKSKQNLQIGFNVFYSKLAFECTF